MKTDAPTALKDPIVQDRLNELHALGLPVVQFFALGKYIFVTASGEIEGRTIRVAADSPLANYRNALHQACANARTIMRDQGIASEGGRAVAQKSVAAEAVALNRMPDATRSREISR